MLLIPASNEKAAETNTKKPCSYQKPPSALLHLKHATIQWFSVEKGNWGQICKPLQLQAIKTDSIPFLSTPCPNKDHLESIFSSTEYHHKITQRKWTLYVVSGPRTHHSRKNLSLTFTPTVPWRTCNSCYCIKNYFHLWQTAEMNNSTVIFASFSQLG